MSTYWYFECVDHDPVIRSDEFTQHTDDLYYKRGLDLARNRPLNPASWQDEGCAPSQLYFDWNARYFLLGHPHCELRVVSEHGVVVDIATGETTGESAS